MEKYQVIFFATSDFAAPALDKLTNDEKIHIQGVVTQPPEESGRHHTQKTETPIAKRAKEKNIPVYEPDQLKGNREILEIIRNYHPDLFIVAAYGNLIPDSLLAIPKFGSINIHPSLLPKYRGASPIQEAILQGDKETGVSIIEVASEMDSGNILMAQHEEITEDDTYESLSTKLAKLGAEMIGPVAIKYMEGRLTPVKQDPNKVSFCKKINREDGKIDWKKMDSAHVLRLVKAYTPWPGCFTTWNGQRLKIRKAIKSSLKGSPGGIILNVMGQSRLFIGTQTDAIEILELQLEGKQEVDSKSFINGYRNTLERRPECA